MREKVRNHLRDMAGVMDPNQRHAFRVCLREMRRVKVTILPARAVLAGRMLLNARNRVRGNPGGEGLVLALQLIRTSPEQIRDSLRKR